MGIAKLLELAATLPSEPVTYIDNPFQQEAYRPLYLPDQISYGIGQLTKDQQRLTVKCVYEHSWQDAKYGERVQVYYLDDKPFVLLRCFGRYLDTGLAYVIDKKVHEESREWLFSLFDSPEVECVSMLTDELVNTLHDGKLVQDGFPFIKTDYDP